MENHWDVFNSYGLKERKCVYTWNGETYNNTKFIKDMIYTKFFIHPRNDFYDTVDGAFDFRKFGSKIYGDDETFYLLKINTMDNWLGEWEHVQEPTDYVYSTTVNMNGKYAHDDKIIAISGTVIQPFQFEVIEKVNVRMYKTNDLGFSFSKTI